MTPEDLIRRIQTLGGLSVAFQPIFESPRPEAGLLRLHSLEALSRGPRDSLFERALALFEASRLAGAALEMDRLCIRTIFEEIAVVTALPAPVALPRLNLNLHSSSLEADPELGLYLVDRAAAAGVPAEKIVVELVEHAPVESTGRLSVALTRLRRHGIRIAIDDIGLGFSNFKIILASRPDYLKIDRFIVHGAAYDVGRRALLSSVAHLGHLLGARVVAEGIETESQLRAVRTEGVDLLQGYLLATPLSVDELQESCLLRREVHPLAEIGTTGESGSGAWAGRRAS